MKQDGVMCGLASLRTGAMLEAEGEGVAELESLAATLPEIYGTIDTACLERIARRLGADAASDPLAEVLLLSPTRVRVTQPLQQHPGTALVADGPADSSVGLVLSLVHSRLKELEGP
jgi:hypothetical protein